MPDIGLAFEATQSTNPSNNFSKATILNRVIAKSLDFLIVLGISEITPPYGFWIGLWYLLVADGFSGRSVGKRLIGLQTRLRGSEVQAGFKDSILRNAPLAVAYFLWQVPYIGWIGSFIILTIEALLMIGNEHGLRIGDEVAHTKVINEQVLNANS